MKIAFAIFVCIFVGSTLFYVPFIHQIESERANKNLTDSLNSTSNELRITNEKLAESDRARLKRLENGGRHRLIYSSTNIDNVVPDNIDDADALLFQQPSGTMFRWDTNTHKWK